MRPKSPIVRVDLQHTHRLDHRGRLPACLPPTHQPNVSTFAVWVRVRVRVKVGWIGSGVFVSESKDGRSSTLLYCCTPSQVLVGALSAITGVKIHGMTAQK